MNLLRGGEEVVPDDVWMRAEEVTKPEVVDNDVWMLAEAVTDGRRSLTCMLRRLWGTEVALACDSKVPDDVCSGHWDLKTADDWLEAWNC